MTEWALSSFVRSDPCRPSSAEAESAERLHSLCRSNAGKTVYRLGALSVQPTFRDQRLWAVGG